MPDALSLIASSLSAGHTFLRAIQMMCEESEAPLSEEFGRVVAETQLGDPVVDALDRMLDELRKLERPDDGDERVITRREEEVLQLIADGCSTPEVASKLYISQKTVKNHLASIYQKLDARDRTQAVLQAVRMGIIHLT